jgi:inosine/xanthosine triphosphate pyrophosphatase family protein
MTILEVRNAPATAVDEFISVDGIVDHNGNYSNFVKELSHQTEIIADRFDKIRALAKEPNTDGKWHIHFGTGNHGKIDEFNNFLAVNEVLQGINAAELLSFAVLGPDHYEEIDENGKTFYENCFLKSNGLSALPQNASRLVMAEDSGISIDILGGAPGVHSARWLYREECIGMLSSLQREHPAIVDQIKVIWAMAPTKSIAKKNEIDFLNKICVIEQIRAIYRLKTGDVYTAVPEIKLPAHFVTTASISSRGWLKHHAVGHMYGKVVIPTEPDYDDPQFLHALSRDFGYNAIFGVESKNSGETVMLSKVSMKDRLRWNHRSIALTRAIVAFLFDKAMMVA